MPSHLHSNPVQTESHHLTEEETESLRQLLNSYGWWHRDSGPGDRRDFRVTFPTCLQTSWTSSSQTARKAVGVLENEGSLKPPC